eukprot:4636214-Amphidinium_carterae.1
MPWVQLEVSVGPLQRGSFAVSGFSAGRGSSGIASTLVSSVIWVKNRSLQGDGTGSRHDDDWEGGRAAMEPCQALGPQHERPPSLGTQLPSIAWSTFASIGTRICVGEA